MTKFTLKTASASLASLAFLALTGCSKGESPKPTAAPDVTGGLSSAVVVGYSISLNDFSDGSPRKPDLVAGYATLDACTTALQEPITTAKPEFAAFMCEDRAAKKITGMFCRLGNCANDQPITEGLDLITYQHMKLWLIAARQNVQKESPFKPN